MIIQRQDRHARDEQGAAVVLVAVFMFFVLFAAAALVVDAGQAFANKRQLQNATDSAVLAAVQVYEDEPGTCTELAGNGALRILAEAAAEEVAEKSRAGHENLGEFDVRCATGAYAGGLEVNYAAGRETPSYFDPGGPIDAEADSNAVMFVPGIAERFRPYGLCSADVPAADSMPTPIVEIKQPGQASGGSGCTSAEVGGNWWFMNCPGYPAGGLNPGELAVVLENGCDTTASVVSPQDPSSPALLSASLTKNCNDKTDASPSCLSAETGNADLKNKTPVGAWSTLLGKSIVVPVFCAKNECDPSTVDGPGGTNVYPVYKFTAVTICAFHFYAKAAEVSTDSTACPSPPTKTYVEKLGCNNDNHACLPVYNEDGVQIGLEKPKDSVRLWVRYTRQVNGLGSPSGCALGDDKCDGGLRQFALSE